MENYIPCQSSRNYREDYGGVDVEQSFSAYFRAMADFFRKTSHNMRVFEEVSEALHSSSVENCQLLKAHGEFPNTSDDISCNTFNSEEREDQEILEENQEMKHLLREFEVGLSLMMQKYRDNVTTMLDEGSYILSHDCDENLLAIIDRQQQQINEMADIMRKSIKADDSQFLKRLETSTFLVKENKSLKELLLIGKKFGTVPCNIKLKRIPFSTKACQTEKPKPKQNQIESSDVDEEEEKGIGKDLYKTTSESGYSTEYKSSADSLSLDLSMLQCSDDEDSSGIFNTVRYMARFEFSDYDESNETDV